MPSWFADPTVGDYSNERRLSDSEIQTIVRWVDGGAPGGNPADLPTPRTFVDGWSIGKPDEDSKAILRIGVLKRIGDPFM